MIRRIRVLHIIKTLSLGGAETNLLNLVGAFDAGKVETHVAYSFGGEIEGRFRAAGVKLFKYADESHRVKSLHSLPIVLRLAAYIRRQRIDIVQTHNFNGHIWGLLAAKLAGAKVIEHVHDHRYTPRDELARRQGLLDQYRFIKFFRRQSDRVIVLTRDNAEYVIRNGIAPADRVLEWQNGISFAESSISEPQALRRRFDISPAAVVILTSARMDPAKNVDLILRIAGRVVEAAPAAIFLVAGSGAHLEDYKSRARQNNVDRYIRFVGFHQNMYDLLAAADVFLLPSFLELHSIAILEALKMKLPVVISQGVGCHDEFIESGSNGYLCDPFLEQPWIDALVRLSNDPDWRKCVGRKGYETCCNLFDIRDKAARFEKLYADVAG
jgi:glycosyltransferase involved in cell wall biosynthesis